MQNLPLIFTYQNYLPTYYSTYNSSVLFSSIPSTQISLYNNFYSQKSNSNSISELQTFKIQLNQSQIKSQQKVQQIAVAEQIIKNMNLKQQKNIDAIRRTWTFQQDKKLKKIAFQKKNDWKLVAEQIGNRNINQCYGRYRRLLKNDCRRAWTKEEDECLKNSVNKYGRCWTKFIDLFKNRTCKQIRERYLNNLRPNIRNENWSGQQDLKIYELINIYGKRWNFFQRFLVGRTENQIKNRYYGHLKRYEQKLDIQKKEIYNK